MRRICPGCRTTYDEAVGTCPRDGLPLLEISRTFAGLQPGAGDEGDAEQVRGFDPNEDANVAVAPGMMVGGYMIERTLAEGGMGAIYAGIHPVISKRVAIKVINKRYAADPKAVARFVLEARSVNQIGHHNIVDIFSIGELDDRRNYMVMELLDGLALSHILLRAQRLKPGQVLPVFEQLCDALDAAHRKGFVHRDLKPDNLLVLRRPPRPFIKILDFGLAKLRGAVVSQNTEVGTVLGTPEYMAPEQCRGATVDARTDIYALGVVAYELLTGVKPFSDSSPFRILSLQQHRIPVPPSRLTPMSPLLEQVILRALAKNPEERYASAGELIADLRRAIPEPMVWPEELVVWQPAHKPDGLAPGDAMRQGLMATLAPVSISGEMEPGEIEDEDNLQTLVSNLPQPRAQGQPPPELPVPQPALLTPPPGPASTSDISDSTTVDALVVVVDRPIDDPRLDGELASGDTMVGTPPAGNNGSADLAVRPALEIGTSPAPAEREPTDPAPAARENAAADALARSEPGQRRPLPAPELAETGKIGRPRSFVDRSGSARKVPPSPMGIGRTMGLGGLALVVLVAGLLAVVLLVRLLR